MPRGIEARPIVKVWKGGIVEIPFAMYDNGTLITPDPSKALKVSASFQSETKFTRTLLIVGDSWALPEEDLFDAVGDWDAIVSMEVETELLHSEKFIFRVQDPVPEVVS